MLTAESILPVARMVLLASSRRPLSLERGTQTTLGRDHTLSHEGFVPANSFNLVTINGELHLTPAGNKQLIVILDRGEMQRRLCVIAKSEAEIEVKNIPQSVIVGPEQLQFNVTNDLIIGSEVTGITVIILSRKSSPATTSFLCSNRGQEINHYLTHPSLSSQRAVIRLIRGSTGFELLTN